MTQELKPVTAEELRQIPEKIKQLEHNRYVERIVKKFTLKFYSKLKINLTKENVTFYLLKMTLI